MESPKPPRRPRQKPENISAVRTAVLLPWDGVILSPNDYRPELFRHPTPVGNTLTNTAQARMDRNSRERYGLPLLSIMHDLGFANGVAGFSVRPTFQTLEIDMDKAPLTAFDLQESIWRADQEPGWLNSVDEVFIRRAFMHRIRGGKLA